MYNTFTVHKYVLCIYLYNIKRDFVTWISRQTKGVWIKKHKISLLKGDQENSIQLLTMWGQSNVDHQNMTYKYNIRINNISTYMLMWIVRCCVGKKTGGTGVLFCLCMWDYWPIRVLICMIILSLYEITN